MANVKVGDKAPEFSLTSSKQKVVNLADLKGKKVILSFYPVAFTPVWENQVSSLEENFDNIQNANATALAISIDSPYANGAWAEKIGVKNTTLLSDFWPHGQVASQYGAFRDKEGIAERANVVLDENHNIIFFKIYNLDEQPNMEEVYGLL